VAPQPEPQPEIWGVAEADRLWAVTLQLHWKVWLVRPGFLMFGYRRFGAWDFVPLLYTPIKTFRQSQ